MVSFSNVQNMSNKIVVVYDTYAPYESLLIQVCSLNPLAIVLVQVRSGTPGQGMYRIDGLDQNYINVPVAELYIGATGEFLIPVNGTKATLSPQINKWKIVNETPFQIVFNVVLSLWEIEILIMIIWKLLGFWKNQGFKILSIAQICLSFEFFGTALRLSYTLVDPYFTFRILLNTPSIVLFTINYPFTLSSGILLNFFCML